MTHMVFVQQSELTLTVLVSELELLVSSDSERTGSHEPGRAFPLHPIFTVAVCKNH